MGRAVLAAATGRAIKDSPVGELPLVAMQPSLPNLALPAQVVSPPEINSENKKGSQGDITSSRLKHME